MTSLWVRLAVSICAAVLIGLAFLDVVFVFWAQGQQDRRRSLEVSAGALAAAQALTNPASREVGERALAQIARDYRVAILAVDHLDQTVSAGDEVDAVRFPLSLLDGRGHLRFAGYEFVSVILSAGSPWRRVVAARRRDDAIGDVLLANRTVLISLAAAGIGIGLLSLYFLRTSVVRPLSRVVELARRGDHAELTRLTSRRRGPMAEISGAVIAMNQRLTDDKAHIAGQLEALTRAHGELANAQRQLVRAGRLATVGQLSAGLAHEIGNPLAILSGYIELLDDDNLSAAERRDTHARMARELDRIHVTVRELLDFSRAPSAEITSPANVRDVLDQVRSLLKPQGRMRDVQLQVEPNPVPHAVVLVDAYGLTQVLLNLLLNAADALQGEGRVRVGVHVGETRVMIDVEDSGPGIAAEHLEHIFEPFFTTKPPGHGTGLGLAVCERIITAAGGDLTAGRSAELGGALFTLTLPLGDPGPTDTPVSGEETSDLSSTSPGDEQLSSPLQSRVKELQGDEAVEEAQGIERR